MGSADQIIGRHPPAGQGEVTRKPVPPQAFQQGEEEIPPGDRVISTDLKASPVLFGERGQFIREVRSGEAPAAGAPAEMVSLQDPFPSPAPGRALEESTKGKPASSATMDLVPQFSKAAHSGAFHPDRERTVSEPSIRVIRAIRRER